jgi:hypothetical protein
MYIKSLVNLVATVFETLGFVTHHPMQILKHPLADSLLSFVLTRPDSKSEYIGIIVRDWKRIVGKRQVYRAMELLEVCPKLNQVILVSSMGFSCAAKNTSDNRENITLISKKELISLMLKQLEIL